MNYYTKKCINIQWAGGMPVVFELNVVQPGDTCRGSPPRRSLMEGAVFYGYRNKRTSGTQTAQKTQPAYVQNRLRMRGWHG